MATGEKKTQDIQKATEVLSTDLLLSTTDPASGNPENKNIKIELLKEFISKEINEKINNLQVDVNALNKKIGDIKDAQSGKIELLFEENVKTERVNFARKMLGARTPSVLLTIGGGSSWTKSLHATATTSDNDGFDLNYGSNSGSGSVTVSWLAVGRDQ